MKELIDAVEILFRVVQKVAWEQLNEEERRALKQAKGKVDAARDLCQGRQGAASPQSGSGGSEVQWNANSEAEKGLTKRLIDWFENEPEGERLSDFEVDVLNSAMKKFEQYGSITKKQLEVLKKAWNRVSDGRPLPTT